MQDTHWGGGPTVLQSVYSTAPVDGEVPVMLELWEMRSTLSLPSFSGPLWLGVVAPDKALPIGQIELKC